MADMFSPEDRSRIMSRIRSRGNAATELRFIEIARKYRLVGWRRGSTLPGKPDFVFLYEKVAVFIDGDFWHGNPMKFRIPRSNVEYWTEKILSNQRRDRKINRLLRSKGWSVLRFWQSSLKDEKAVVSRLRRVLTKKRREREEERRAL
jgi:DNA mismatch endonuclease, patch repair protein